MANALHVAILDAAAFLIHSGQHTLHTSLLDERNIREEKKYCRYNQEEFQHPKNNKEKIELQ